MTDKVLLIIQRRDAKELIKRLPISSRHYNICQFVANGEINSFEIPMEEFLSFNPIEESLK